MPPDQAAISIARKYASATGGVYAAREITSGERDGARTVTYLVLRDQQECALVSVRDFIGSGWKEDSYEALD